MKQSQDIIQQLEELAFASRLKRISEGLMRDVSRIYSELDFTFEARWFSLSYLLLRRKQIPVTTAATELGMTHPAINQIAAQMSKAGLLLSKKDRTDERKRILYLSAKGKVELKKLESLWDTIKTCNRELILDVNKNLLSTLDRLEKKLSEKDMYERVMESIKWDQYQAVEIVRFKPAFKKYFAHLNKTWLKKYFTVEPEDIKLLSDPYNEIIKKGGQIFFAKLNGRFIGTAALIAVSGNTFEIAKVAVDPKFQRKQAAKKLVVSAIEYALNKKAKYIYSLTNSKLTASIELFTHLGFEEKINKKRTGKYHRKSIYMKLKRQKYRKLKPKE